MKLEINCLFAELVYNISRTNALNFIGEDVSFAITAATYLEEDDPFLNEIELCLDGRDETRIYGCEAVRVFDRRIEIDLGAQNLDKKYESISLLFQIRIP